MMYKLLCAASTGELNAHKSPMIVPKLANPIVLVFILFH